MNILFVCHVFHPSVGGIETSALLLIREFLALGHGLRVLTHSELGQASEMAAFPVFRRPSMREQLRLAAWADVVYQHNPSLTYLLPLEWKGRGAVSVHTWVSRTDGRRSLRDRLKLAWLGRWPVIANSRAMARALPMPATVIENGYDDQVFDTIGAGGFEAREGAVFVGRLVSDKGARYAVEAIAALRDAGRPMPLSLVGEGPERAALEAEVRARGLSGLVHFAGRLPPGEVAALLRRARYLLVPSLWEEPFGIVALEGIACGCLVVATDGGGLADAVGDCGLLVPRGDADALARAITRLEEDAALRARLVAARAAHLDAHRPRTVAERHLAVLAAHRSSVLHPSPPASTQEPAAGGRSLFPSPSGRRWREAPDEGERALGSRAQAAGEETERSLPARGERGVVQPSDGYTDEPSSPSPRVRGEGRGEG